MLWVLHLLLGVHFLHFDGHICSLKEEGNRREDKDEERAKADATSADILGYGTQSNAVHRAHTVQYSIQSTHSRT
jgi:hypothetical protein